MDYLEALVYGTTEEVFGLVLWDGATLGWSELVAAEHGTTVDHTVRDAAPELGRGGDRVSR
jgi:hypothetical protein